MKRVISLFTVLMLLFVGSAMGQDPAPNQSPGLTDDHNVELNIEDWSYIDVQGEDVTFDVHTLNDGYDGSGGQEKYSSSSSKLVYGTNSHSDLNVMVTSSSPTSSHVQFFLRPNSNGMTVNQDQFTIGSAGSFVEHQGELGQNPDTFIQGVNRGGGEVDPLIYDMWVQFFESNESGDLNTTVTYTLTAGGT